MPIVKKSLPAKSAPRKLTANQLLRNEVLSIIDQLWKKFYIDRESRNLSLSVLNALILEYASMNCELCFIFEEKVEPFVKKMKEVERLQLVKGLLTDGYIDIKKKRIYLRHLPFLNYKKVSKEQEFLYISDIPKKTKLK